MVYPRKWSPISYRLSAGQRKHASQRPTLYRWTTQPTKNSVKALKAMLQSSSGCVQTIINTEGGCCTQGGGYIQLCWSAYLFISFISYVVFTCTVVRFTFLQAVQRCTLSQVWHGHWSSRPTARSRRRAVNCTWPVTSETSWRRVLRSHTRSPRRSSHKSTLTTTSCRKLTYTSMCRRLVVRH